MIQRDTNRVGPEDFAFKKKWSSEGTFVHGKKSLTDKETLITPDRR